MLRVMEDMENRGRTQVQSEEILIITQRIETEKNGKTELTMSTQDKLTFNMKTSRNSWSGLCHLEIEVWAGQSLESTTVDAYTKIFTYARSESDFITSAKRFFHKIGMRLLIIEEIEHGCEFSNSSKMSIQNSNPTILFEGLHVVSANKENNNCLYSAVHEKLFVDNFVSQKLKSRFYEQLPMFLRKKGRARILTKLAHEDFIDADACNQFDVSCLSSTEITLTLQGYGVESICYVISENSAWDGQYWALEEIISESIGSGYGIIVSCIPGQVCYIEQEDRNSRRILHRVNSSLTIMDKI